MSGIEIPCLRTDSQHKCMHVISPFPVLFCSGSCVRFVLLRPCRHSVSRESVENSEEKGDTSVAFPSVHSNVRLINALALYGLGPVFLGVTALVCVDCPAVLLTPTSPITPPRLSEGE